jgi:hypothetical protein
VLGGGTSSSLTANEGIDENAFAIVGEDGNSVLNPTDQQKVRHIFQHVSRVLDTIAT